MSHDGVIEEGWQEVELLLSGASEEQVTQARRLFFAGALHLWTELVDLLGDDDLSDRRKDFKLIDVQHELEQFAADSEAFMPEKRLDG